jgi:ankyrin
LLTALGHPDSIHRADIRLSDISNLLGADWVPLASELGISTSDVNLIKTEYPHNVNQQAAVMLQLWQHTAGNKATGKILLPLSMEVTATHKFYITVSTQ